MASSSRASTPERTRRAGAALAAAIFSVSVSSVRPAGLPPAIASALAGAEAIELREGGTLAATFWIRRELPPAPADTSGGPALPAERVAFPNVPAGALVGAVAFASPWRDYRDREVPAGLYTLRYLRQPAIKEHKGVSEFRDFLVMTPAASDRAVDVGAAEVAPRSADAFGRGHPAVMAIVPAPRTSSPRIFGDDRGEAALAVAAGAESMGLVVSGHGRLEDSGP